MLNTVSAKAAKDTPLSYSISPYYGYIPPAFTYFFISLPTYFLVATISHLALEEKRGGIIPGTIKQRSHSADNSLTGILSCHFILSGWANYFSIDQD